MRDARRGEGVGFEDVRAGHRVLIVDLFDRGRLSQDKEVVVALLMAGTTAEALAAEMILAETKPLDLGAHGAVEDENSLSRGFLELIARVRSFRCFQRAEQRVYGGVRI